MIKFKEETKFKMNSNNDVINYNHDSIFPDKDGPEYRRNIRTFSLTDEHQSKLEQLRAKYKVSRSAILRILLDSVEV